MEEDTDMSKKPRTVVHKYTGESITFVEISSETNGKYLLIEVTLPPLGDGPPLHCHDQFVEQFTVLEGELTVKIEKQEKVLHAGETLTVTAKVAHTFRNISNSPVTFNVKLTPPSQFEQSVRIHYGLMDDGLTKEDGVPKSIFHSALILTLQNTLIAGKSLWLQRVLFGLIIKIGRLTGAYKGLRKYTETDFLK